MAFLQKQVEELKGVRRRKETNQKVGMGGLEKRTPRFSLRFPEKKQEVSLEGDTVHHSPECPCVYPTISPDPSAGPLPPHGGLEPKRERGVPWGIRPRTRMPAPTKVLHVSGDNYTCMLKRKKSCSTP